MTMTGKERAELRSECNRLKPTMHIGHEGITGPVLAALDDALRTRELVKIQLNKSVEVSAKSAANDLAKRVKAEVIQVIGRTTTLYRHNPELKRKKGDAPPWR
ncbi:YhbY family RNA-binding protein [Pseudogemmatithrix spongiicola]|uniref:YhbY family RNA-binding protein n=1 Tax=Pseudogemmatithrix spongiicola TaxID=3062599 RepID=A0AA49K2D0_9BACT|nr:YhbY family RNA-binding protein [Gemmatimonadaceae bacterium 'strain 138']WKW16341.1 YhbY family RNA-binding protein [Gemmatimonadaceae bacterium 'strain 318']